MSVEELFSYFWSHTDHNISLTFYINIAHSSIWGGLRSIFEDLFRIVFQYINNTFRGSVFQSRLSFEGQKEAFGIVCPMMKAKQTMIQGRWWGIVNEFCHGIREVNLNILKLNLRKRMGFVLIDFEEGYFSLLTLFRLSKNHMLVTCSKILLNTTAKITPGCKVW